MLTETEHGITLRFEDIPSLLNREVTSPYVTLESRLTKLFEEATLLSDLEPFEEGLYPQDLIEGFHLLGLLDYFVAKHIDLDRKTVYGLNYGLDRVRFVSPMRTGVPLRFRATVDRIEPKGDGYLVYFDCALEHEGADRPGVLARWICFELPVENSIRDGIQ
jgi:hypothetical protein